MNWRRANKSKNKHLALVTAVILGVTLLSVAFIASYDEHVFAGGGVSITRNYLTSSADTHIDQSAATTNYGSSTTLNVRSRSGKNARALVQLNISEIPTGSTVSSSTLQLYLTTAYSSSRTHDVHRVTASWTEAGATWNTRDGTTAWTTAGGDFTATATNTVATGTTSGVWLSWTVTTDVSAYLGGTATNYGWLVKDQTEGATGAGINTYYASKEYGSNQPKISVTFTAPFDSYSDSGRTTQTDTFSNGTNHVYMKGTGFPNGNYNVGYYDTVGDWVATSSNVSVTDGTLLSDYLLTTDPSAAGNGTWYALVQPASGYTSFGANTYSTITASPDTYGLVANDSFYVENSAIPEFTTVMAGIMVAGLCFGIYWWMRKRANRVYSVH